MSYQPTGTTPELVLQSLNDYLGIELALPGNWPPNLFYQDLQDYPVETKRKLAVAVQSGLTESKNYLEFFEETRGFKRPTSEEQLEIWKIFSCGSLMLYFEPLFLRLLDRPQMEGYQVILAYLQALSETAVMYWNSILEGVGACCYQFFGKEPDLYARLITRTSADTPEEMTDQEILDAINSNLSPTAYNNKISTEDSRSALIQKYTALVQSTLV